MMRIGKLQRNLLATIAAKRNRVIMIILLCLLAISVTGCLGPVGSATTIPEDLGTYSKNGFSFEYPKEFVVSEMGLLACQANEYSGAVQVGVRGDETKLFEVVWMKNLHYSLENALENVFAIMKENNEIAGVARDEVVEVDKAGHRMLYQYYTATSASGQGLCGIAGVFYCDDSQNFYSLATMNSDITVKQDALQNFQTYLGSFACH